MFLSLSGVLDVDSTTKTRGMVDDGLLDQLICEDLCDEQSG